MEFNEDDFLYQAMRDLEREKGLGLDLSLASIELFSGLQGPTRVGDAEFGENLARLTLECMTKTQCEDRIVELEAQIFKRMRFLVGAMKKACILPSELAQPIADKLDQFGNYRNLTVLLASSRLLLESFLIYDYLTIARKEGVKEPLASLIKEHSVLVEGVMAKTD